ncbi:hypothetical protein CR159_21195 [Pollutimonas subterranea]|uniref:Uncharacterized protein n=1 Tax=Pollutimonas subterranea TaxID=2045210 RepID=A0A2N4TYM9_9BURK|nr:hypothetical protein CR159_21195 [Pollutimonas subterranea]
MRDINGHLILSLLLKEAVLPPPRAITGKLGRPLKANALSAAERARRYRARKKARLAELRDEKNPVRSAIIDLSALPPWKRK